MSAEERALLLVCWRKSYGAVIDASLKAAVAPNVPHPDCCRSAKEVSLECRRTVLFYQSALVDVAGKPVGKPDALVGHVRFDERGRETTGCP
jgi:hypothetical protein